MNLPASDNNQASGGARTPRYWAVIPAAGIGSRMQASTPKQYLELAGKAVIEHTLETLCQVDRVEQLVVCVASDDSRWEPLSVASHPKIDRVAGGAERCHSVLNGLQHLSSLARDDDWVLVHDVVRPCITVALIDQLIDELNADAVGGLLAVPVAETLKIASTDQRVQECPDRQHYWLAQTPQMFRFGLLKRALEEAISAGELVTDESAAVERLGAAPKLVAGRTDNIKITRPDDLALAEFILQKQPGSDRPGKNQ